MKATHAQPAQIPVDDVHIEGMLELPAEPQGIVLFAHGSGSSRHSPRNNAILTPCFPPNQATMPRTNDSTRGPPENDVSQALR